MLVIDLNAIFAFLVSLLAVYVQFSLAAIAGYYVLVGIIALISRSKGNAINWVLFFVFPVKTWIKLSRDIVRFVSFCFACLALIQFSVYRRITTFMVEDRLTSILMVILRVENSQAYNKIVRDLRKEHKAELDNERKRNKNFRHELAELQRLVKWYETLIAIMKEENLNVQQAFTFMNTIMNGSKSNKQGKKNQGQKKGNQNQQNNGQYQYENDTVDEMPQDDFDTRPAFLVH